MSSPWTTSSVTQWTCNDPGQPRDLALKSVQNVGEEPVGKLGLKPGGFGGHDLPGIGYRHEVRHTGGVEGKCDRHLSAINPSFEFP